MSAMTIIFIVLGYFVVLIGISWVTGKGADNKTFYLGNKQSPWYIVAFGMIGASLSGITFISIPGTVAASQFSYMQIVIGYMLGYAVIAFVLMPLYYRMNLTSIYGYLGQRIGPLAYKTGAAYFLLSRIIGASLRLYLVANVLQEFLFNQWGVPFELTVAISILLIWIYTFRGGIRTIIWTDSLQTLFMLIALGMSIYLISDDLGLGNITGAIDEAGYSRWFFTDDVYSSKYFLKQILAGAFIAICMTGLDQDMMQKNLSCRNIAEAKKNMISFSVILFFVNLVFLVLGGLLFLYMDARPAVGEAMAARGNDMDLLFPTIAMEGGLGVALGIFFLLGLIAAAYSSADSALTSLTTSVCVDFLNGESKEEQAQVRQRKRVHVIMSLVLLLTVIIFKQVKSDNVIWELFKAAQYTYGPLLGLFFFGILTSRKVRDRYVLPVCVLAPVASFFFNRWIASHEDWFQFGFELIVVNGLLTFTGLLLISSAAKKTV